MPLLSKMPSPDLSFTRSEASVYLNYHWYTVHEARWPLSDPPPEPLATSMEELYSAYHELDYPHATTKQIFEVCWKTVPETDWFLWYRLCGPKDLEHELYGHDERRDIVADPEPPEVNETWERHAATMREVERLTNDGKIGMAEFCVWMKEEYRLDFGAFLALWMLRRGDGEPRCDYHGDKDCGCCDMSIEQVLRDVIQALRKEEKGWNCSDYNSPMTL